jgi:hypothetical protein
VPKVEKRECFAEHRKVRSMTRNVRSMAEIATLFSPTDRTHLARFILPSSVARLLRPIPELQASRNEQRIATNCTFDHRYKSSDG